MLKLKITSIFIVVAVFNIASARFKHQSTRQKFVNELTKNLAIALETNHGRVNFEVFRNLVMRYEYDCKRHAINKVIQSHKRDEKQRIATIERYYDHNRYKNFAAPAGFKFNKNVDYAAIRKKSSDAAIQTVTLCANMEAISAGRTPNIH